MSLFRIGNRIISTAMATKIEYEPATGVLRLYHLSNSYETFAGEEAQAVRRHFFAQPDGSNSIPVLEINDCDRKEAVLIQPVGFSQKMPENP